jgi:ZIP family zinc transporter
MSEIEFPALLLASELAAASGWGVAVGASLLAGAAAGARLRVPAGAATTLTSFAGGLLFSAVALGLVPEADELAGRWLTAAGLLAGMLVLVGAEALLTRDENKAKMRRSAHAAAAGRPMTMPDEPGEAHRGEVVAAGLVVDGVPESIALGLTIAEGGVALPLLVGVLVGNLLEARGAAQAIVDGGRSQRFAVALLGAIGLALAASTVLGGTVLADVGGSLVGTAQAVAAGAVLAVVAISIVPHAFAEVGKLVPSATVLGFVCGYLLA